jgi:2-polyprenyl-3-methyl-5-hydroxy-6-metoxy-1,4-benzoquinol methylase
MVPPQERELMINELEPLRELYIGYRTDPLSYGTVADYCDSFDHLNHLATALGDMKDCQRPWTLKALIGRLKPNSRVLEIGAGEPLVADLLQKLGHEVWIIDPYDGSGHGPTYFDEYQNQYPDLHFSRNYFSEELTGISDRSLDCIYSISVLEHVPIPSLPGIFSGIKKFLKDEGISLHAVDHVLKGNGDEYHKAHLRTLIEGFGFSQSELEDQITKLKDDAETYYLSAESHNRWRGATPYEKFPMRVCASIQILADAAQIRAGKRD